MAQQRAISRRNHSRLPCQEPAVPVQRTCAQGAYFKAVPTVRSIQWSVCCIMVGAETAHSQGMEDSSVSGYRAEIAYLAKIRSIKRGFDRNL